MSISSIGGLGRDPVAKNIPDFEDVHSVAEACRLLRCSRASLYRMIALGQLQRVKVLSRTFPDPKRRTNDGSVDESEHQKALTAAVCP